MKARKKRFWALFMTAFMVVMAVGQMAVMAKEYRGTCTDIHYGDSDKYVGTISYDEDAIEEGTVLEVGDVIALDHSIIDALRFWVQIKYNIGNDNTFDSEVEHDTITVLPLDSVGLKPVEGKVLKGWKVTSIEYGEVGSGKYIVSYNVDPVFVDAPKAKPVTANNVKADDGATVSTRANGTAVVSKVDAKAKAVTLDTVTVDGVDYKVDTVKKDVFKKTSATKVTLGESVNKIESKAFNGAKVKTITINATGKVKVAKTAFKGSKVDTKKMTIKVTKKMSKKNFAALKKSLLKAGFKGKIKRA